MSWGGTTPGRRSLGSPTRSPGAGNRSNRTRRGGEPGRATGRGGGLWGIGILLAARRRPRGEGGYAVRRAQRYRDARRDRGPEGGVSPPARPDPPPPASSEERRVGKEARARRLRGPDTVCDRERGWRR